ncbi:hypothetical protein BHE74_00046666 [Ensete ventricosum]|nr:hypothetical protein GW17_00032054 [Ensete ventricosum]RWW47354.1 hypothetical protein BHE74_00046666 [Ensete ventricosum]
MSFFAIQQEAQRAWRPWMTVWGFRLLSFFTKISNCCVLYMLIEFVYRVVFLLYSFYGKL